MTFTVKEALTGLAAIVVGIAAYGMDWQRDQDDHVDKMHEILIQQTMYVEMQNMVNENTKEEFEQIKEQVKELKEKKADK